MIKIVGHATVFSAAEGKEIPVQIQKSNCDGSASRKKYTLITVETGLELGSVEFEWCRKMGGSIGIPYDYTNYTDCFKPYATEADPRPTGIFVRMLNGQKSHKKDSAYKGVGTVLMHAVFEYALRKKTGGHMVLGAAWSSHIFYYKLGLRPYRDEEETEGILEARIAKAKERGLEPDTSDFLTIPMLLPVAAIESWKKMTTEMPILIKTKEGNLVSKVMRDE